jgi:hypothetical protein
VQLSLLYFLAAGMGVIGTHWLVYMGEGSAVCIWWVAAPAAGACVVRRGID